MLDKGIVLTLLFGLNLALFAFLLYLHLFSVEKFSKISQINRIKKSYNYEELFPSITYSKDDTAEVLFRSKSDEKNKDISNCINANVEHPKLRLEAMKQCLPLFQEYLPSPKKDVKGLVKGVPNFVPAFGEAPSVVSYPYEKIDWNDIYKTPLSKENILNILGYYNATRVAKEYYDDIPGVEPDYKNPHLGIFNMDDYCNVHDILIQHNKELAFKKYFVTDYHHLGLPRMFVMNLIGEDLMPKLSKNMHKLNYIQKQYPIDFRASMFYFKKADIHNFHEIGKHFACFGQSYNHIPGHGGIIRKDLLTKNSMDWMGKFSANKKCYSNINYFPMGYRLDKQNECKEFFKILSSEEYKNKPPGIKKFIMKVGFGVHRGAGVKLLDEVYEKSLKEQYENGAKCGYISINQIAQEYIDPPLLFKGRKFDFRIYMLVSSTNPLRIYYHDGFLRVSLDNYNRTSNKENMAITNTELSKKIIKHAEETKELYNGMTADQLRELQMQSMEDLEDHLVEQGRVKKGWLESYLRPEIQKSFISSVKMIEKNLHKSSTFFETFGVDIILEESFKVKILEINASPMIVGTTERKTNLMKKMLMGLFNITFAQQFSRTERGMNYIEKHKNEIQNGENQEAHLEKFMKLIDNTVEPKYKQSFENNPWQQIYDGSLKGKEKYFGLYDEECSSLIDKVVDETTGY